MKIDDSDIRNQLSLGEDGSWEFKEVVFAGNHPKEPKRDRLADEIAAFANAKGGVMLLGVTDAGEIKAMTRDQMDLLERLLVEICIDVIEPPLRSQINRKGLESGERFLMIEIPKGDAMHKSPGGYYQRTGSSARKMTTDEHFRLAQRRAQSRFLWFDKQPVPDTGLDVFDIELWRPLLSAEGGKNPESALQKINLLENGDAEIPRATVAGILLCTPNPHEWIPKATISAASYAGPDRASGQLDACEITGPLDRQIGEALRFVKRNMRVAARKNPGRIDMPQYSLRAVFEAVVNAVAHRDYSIKERRIRLAMFDDHLQISSPGELPNGMTVDTMSDNQSTRNEALTSIFGRMRVNGIPGSEEREFLMEQRGDGVRIIIRETLELCGKKPEYAVVDGRELRLTIPAASHKSDPRHAVVKVLAAGKPLPETELLILYPNNTRLLEATDQSGEARFELYTPELPMRVFACAPGKAAHSEEDWIPSSGTLEIGIEALPEGGSVILPDGAGEIPGLSGRLKIERDDQGRSRLSARGMAIGKRKPQPVIFLLGETLRLTDSFGDAFDVCIVDLAGRSALVEYRAVPPAKVGG